MVRHDRSFLHVHDRTLLVMAAGAAFGASLLAISEHVRCMEQGYAFGAARREHSVLNREALTAERRLAAARSPVAVLARCKAWNLGLDHYSSPPPLPPAAAVTPTGAAQSAAQAGR